MFKSDSMDNKKKICEGCDGGERKFGRINTDAGGFGKI